MPKVQLGIDRLLCEQLEVVRGRRLGIVTNHTALTDDHRHLVDVLVEQSDCTVVALFGPEHGIRGITDRKVASGMDAATGLPIHSLYGETFKPTPEMLDGLDMLLFDIQDVGVRFYTYTTTLLYTMQAAAERGVAFVVLDRPNPINGVAVEGNLLEQGFESMVGPTTLPVRHGMTVGEISRLYKGELVKDVDLTVVPLKGWRRRDWWDSTGLLWVPPSPAMPALSTATVYPGTCFVEGINVSEGRGTVLPFEIIGAPWVDGTALAAAMNTLNLPGFWFRPVEFTPRAYKHAGKRCSGVHVHVIDREETQPALMGIHLVHQLLRLTPDQVAFRAPYRAGHPPPFDNLLGCSRVREALQAGASVAEITASWPEDVHTFRQRRMPFLLYG